MKKLLLLSFCFLSVCALSGCGNVSNGQEVNDTEFFIAEEDMPVIDATTHPNNRCGVNGISCNDTPLVNYSKTEADYRAYGERTRRDHLYTQAAAGNNLTATIRPGIEDDVVISQIPASLSENKVQNKTPHVNVNNNQQVKRTRSVEIICGDRCDDRCDDRYDGRCDDKCADRCDELMNDDIITSEFTDEAFNLPNDTELFGFKDIGAETKITSNIITEEVSISDDTILTWEAEEGDNLRELLTKWSAISGWKLLWNTNRNYVLSAGVMFKGKFADVSSALIRAFARARPAPIATYYKGNRVIVVETMENENAY